MSTLSVPLNAEHEAFIESYIKSGKAENKAQVVRRALTRLSEDEAVQAILDAEKEPMLRGDLRELLRKVK